MMWAQVCARCLRRSGPVGIDVGRGPPLPMLFWTWSGASAWGSGSSDGHLEQTLASRRL